jgi:hypothetical protein
MNKKNIYIEILIKGLPFIAVALILFILNKWKYNFWIQDIGAIATIVFGITSGVLALVGLVAIFVSLNSQHKIQKSRELYWEVINLSNKISDPLDISAQMTNLLWQYTKITAFDKEDFIKLIIRGSQKTVMLVLVIWASFMPFLNILPLDRNIIWIGFMGGTFALLFFHSIIGRLENLIDIGKLKNPKDILNIKTNKDFQPFIFLANNIQLETIRKENILPIRFKLTAPILGFKMSIKAVKYITESSAHDALNNKTDMKEIFIPKPKSNNKNLNNYFEVANVNLKITDFDTKLQDWVNKGSFWSTCSKEELRIIRLNDLDESNEMNNQSRYVMQNLTNGSQVLAAVVPSDTYAVRIYASISIDEETAKNEEKPAEEINIIWEIPIDYVEEKVDARIVRVVVRCNGIKNGKNYWTHDKITADFEYIDKKNKEKGYGWILD